MKIGVAYYPEHWPESRWATDARLISQMSIDLVRVGDFAWSRLEPRRERFDLDWLEEAIGVLADHDLKVILCTPTAAPPPWLFNRHPDMVPVDRNGNPWNMGSRRHACLNHRAYQKYVRRIVTELAKNFGGHPDVYAWQIDNEMGTYGSGRCYCDHCQQAFRQWLKGRYGSIDRLNRIWGTSFWSQEFTNWYEIPVPKRTPAGPHPSLTMDYSRFTSATYREFMNQQVEIIKKYAGDECILTTNITGLEVDQIDQFSLGAFQDVASIDNYPLDEDGIDEAALRLDFARSIKDGPFWVMEQQSGATTLPARHSQPRPGQLRLWAYQAAARGADMINFFRWRTCRFGQEMEWQGLLDGSGSPGRRFKELQKAIAEIKGKHDLWKADSPRTSVGMVLDYEAHWALRNSSLGTTIDYMDHVRELHALLRELGVQVDFLGPGGDPAAYDAVVLPMPFVWSEDKMDGLEVYIVGGGTVLVTAPAGYRTGANTAHSGPPPGELSDLLGIAVEEHDLMRPDCSNALDFGIGEAAEKCEYWGLSSIIDLRGASPLATYEKGYYSGTPAATIHQTGEGQALFMGATCGAGAYRKILEKMLEVSGAERWNWASETVEVVPLESSNGEGEKVFVLNHSPETARLPLGEKATCRDLLTDREHRAAVELDGYGVALLKL